MANNFYLTLMSNSSLNYYTENKTSGFTVHLPQKIQLTGDWVVALAELHYPYNFFNVTKNENEMTVGYVRTADGANRTRRTEFTISPGFYRSVGDILKAVNTCLFTETGGDIFSIDELNGRTLVNHSRCFEKGFVSIKLSNRLAMQLGFKPGDNILNSKVSASIGNIYYGIPDQMLIYTDVIEPVLIGHERAQVIKIVNTNAGSKTCGFGDVHTMEFQHMHYVPVMKKEFESIAINIRDYTGGYMPFRHGVSTIKLHFKKV